MSSQQVFMKEFRDDDFQAIGGRWPSSQQGMWFSFDAHFPIAREHDEGDDVTPPLTSYGLYDHITVENVLCFDDDGDQVGLDAAMLERLQEDVRATYSEDEEMFADLWISY